MRTSFQFVSLVAVILWVAGGVGAAPTNLPLSPALPLPRPGAQEVWIPSPFGLVLAMMPGVYIERPPAGLEQTPMAGVGNFSPSGYHLYFYLTRPIDEQCYHAALSARAEKRGMHFYYRDESVISRSTVNRQPSELRTLEGCVL